MTKCITIAICSLLCLAAAVSADPLPGQVLKFDQQPMVATLVGGNVGNAITYFGHDEASEANASMMINNWWQYTGTAWMADDFADTRDTPVVHLKWWGSYVGQQPADTGYARKFLIEFLSDVPAVGSIPSRPGLLLQAQVVTLGQITPQSGTFTETLVRPGDPVLGEKLFEYNCELKSPFPQLANTVYWLKIVHLDDTPLQNYTWGWHNRDYTIMDPLASPLVNPGERPIGMLPDGQLIWHFQDNAVAGTQISLWVDPLGNPSEIIENLNSSLPQHYIPGYDGPLMIDGLSKDLAFQLYTVPEPGAMALLLVGGLAVARRLRRR